MFNVSNLSKTHSNSDNFFPKLDTMILLKVKKDIMFQSPFRKMSINLWKITVALLDVESNIFVGRVNIQYNELSDYVSQHRRVHFLFRNDYE